MLSQVVSLALPSTSDNKFLKVTGRFPFKLQVYKLQLLKYFWHTLLKELYFVCNLGSLNMIIFQFMLLPTEMYLLGISNSHAMINPEQKLKWPEPLMLLKKLYLFYIENSFVSRFNLLNVTLITS